MSLKSFVILGVSHRVQGDMDFVNAIHDPDYAQVVSEIIYRDHVDFVGEECAKNATVAEKVAQDLLGSGHYLKVDPPIEDRESHGIGEMYCPPALGGLPVHGWIVAESEKRENIWVDQLIEQTTEKGLLICGYLHVFSVGAKLLNRRFRVEARTYVPWQKFCR